MFDNLIGKPNDAQLRKINACLPDPVEADEICVITLRASDNLLSRSIRSWHPNVLQQMSETLIGKSLLLDHEWDDCEDSVGFIFDAIYQVDKKCPEEIYNQPGKTERNKTIIKANGYHTVLCQAAIKADMLELINKLYYGAIKNCSTGGLLSAVRMICPNCSQEKGREVCFDERDKNGDYVCPHEIPSQYSEYFSQSSSSLQVADYLILDGVFDGVELSLCNIGNLPAAKLVY